MQCSWRDQVALVDPLAVDVAPLAAVLEGDATMVTHAGDQDLAILERATGAVPRRLFDTQVAAGFVGLGQPGLAELARRLLDEHLPKSHQLSDWTRRPLGVQQQAYAAADVAHLLDLHRVLRARLEEQGRLEWALEECDALRRRARDERDPETVWWKIKGSRKLRGESRGVAQTVAAWRERTAAAQDVPPRFVLADLALAGIAQRRPKSAAELRDLRGMPRNPSRDLTDALLAAIDEGRHLEPAAVRRPPEADELDRSLGPAATIVLAWCQQRAGALGLHSPLLATRGDVIAFLASRSGPLAHGWRHDAVAADIEALLDGRASLVLADGGHRLELRDS